LGNVSEFSLDLTIVWACFLYDFGINSWYLFSIDFRTYCFKYFCGSWDENGAEVVTQNCQKIIKKSNLLPLSIILVILARFGINLVPFWCAFGDLR